MLVWAFWPASAASLYEHGARLMESKDPADWKIAWREIEARLALGDLSFLDKGSKPAPLFKDYAELWLRIYADVECKPSTKRSYEQLLRMNNSSGCMSPRNLATNA